MKIVNIRDGFTQDEIVIDFDDDRHVVVSKDFMKVFYRKSNQTGERDLLSFLAHQYSSIVQKDFERWVKIDHEMIKEKIQ